MSAGVGGDLMAPSRLPMVQHRLERPVQHPAVPLHRVGLAEHAEDDLGMAERTGQSRAAIGHCSWDRCAPRL